LAFLALAASAEARVVIVGIDGASWNRIDPLLAEGALPNLAALAARGLTGELAAVEPVISPTVWTSIATGRSPAAHGITDFYTDARDVRVPTAFERLAARGLRVGLYDWLVAWPPARFPKGFVIPGWLRRDARFEPPDAFARAGASPYFWNVDGLRTPDAFAAASRDEVEQKPGRFVRLLRAFDLDVATVTYYCVDTTSHRFWRAGYPGEFSDPPAVPPDPRFAGAIRDALVGVDRGIGEIAAALGPDDVVVIVSDHGFQANVEGARTLWSTDVGALLGPSGLDPGRDAFTANGFAYLVLRVLPGPFAEREATLARLEALLASATTRDGEPLFQVLGMDGNAREAGPGRGLRWRLEGWALQAGLWWLGARLDAPAHAWLVGVPHASLLAGLAPDAPVRVAGREMPLRALFGPDAFDGRHAPTGVFAAAGGPIRREPQRVAVSVLDVAPLLFALAGQPLPDDLEHPLRTDLLDAAWVAAHPAKRVAAAEMPGLPHGEAAPAASDDATTERLRSLGYVR
jgi:predicted AlkP superfamily phosphohydrolase/phosphomutase